MLSQPSSPSHSRTTSPNRLRNDGSATVSGNVSGGRQVGGGQQQQRGNRTSRRPSVDTTPPPQQNQIITLVAATENDVLAQNIKGFDDVSEFRPSKLLLLQKCS